MIISRLSIEHTAKMYLGFSKNHKERYKQLSRSKMSKLKAYSAHFFWNFIKNSLKYKLNQNSLDIEIIEKKILKRLILSGEEILHSRHCQTHK